ncbi:MAG: 2-oxoglutarate dehydrogenase E1 component, partial [Pseudolabrys sp.]|nr:2-oxoglutarate dehydrogenase E1 component [Pseudolabrys sp.]
LSEFAVMGFEFGYTVADPLTLVMWEAQFGDFVNGAQIMIDQFLTVSMQKWGQPSGLVLLLPHGYEGQGPEHSSARIERFLTLCAEDNIQVVNCTTPAQYFHVLRRQVYGGPDKRGMRKPLVIFTPKSLLRHPKVVSRIDEFTSGAFREVIGETSAMSTDRVNRVLICSGKVYYDLYEEREKRGIDDIYILRVEQLYPFPTKAIANELSRFKQAEVVWCQEEPRNMGAWHFVEHYIEWVLNQIEAKQRRPRYATRPASASTAVGQMSKHLAQLKQLLDEALG